MIRSRWTFVAMLAAWSVVAMSFAASAVLSSFAPVDPASARELKLTIGKPFTSGYVFVDGRYLPPPYKVERYGTVIRINHVQVTGEIVPWEQFVKTQEGVEVSKSVVGGETSAAAPAAASSDDLFADEPAAESEPEAESESSLEAEGEDFDDEGSSLDDLFEDNPEPKPKKKEQPKKKKPKIAPKPKVRRPTVTVNYVLKGAFVHNDKTRAYLKKINDERTRIERVLRMGGYFCFGSRYGAVSGDERQCRLLMGKLPEIQRDHADAAAFNAAMRQAGFTYYPPALIRDLVRNRFGYLELLKRRKAEKEAKQWQNLGL